jgi:hypothetical protein
VEICVERRLHPFLHLAIDFACCRERERDGKERERNKARWREEKFERKVAQLSAASASLLAIPAPLGYLDACERAER